MPEIKYRLTNRQRVFVEEYLKCWNASQSALIAGYSPKGITVTASQTLAKPSVRALIQQRLAEKVLSTDEVLVRLSAQARGNLTPFLTENGKSFDLNSDTAKANIDLVKKAKFKNRRGGYHDSQWQEEEVEIELYDAQAALVQIGKLLGMFGMEPSSMITNNMLIVTNVQELIAASGIPLADVLAEISEITKELQQQETKMIEAKVSDASDALSDKESQSDANNNPIV